MTSSSRRVEVLGHHLDKVTGPDLVRRGLSGECRAASPYRSHVRVDDDRRLFPYRTDPDRVVVVELDAFKERLARRGQEDLTARCDSHRPQLFGQFAGPLGAVGHRG
jgi:hypothetical protein